MVVTVFSRHRAQPRIWARCTSAAHKRSSIPPVVQRPYTPYHHAVGGAVAVAATPLHALNEYGVDNLVPKTPVPLAVHAAHPDQAGGPRFAAATATHAGLVRPSNEDALLSYVPADPQLLLARGALFGVADGVGGQAAGEVASQTAVDVLAAEYYSPRAPHQIEHALGQALRAANLRVFNLAHGAGPALRFMQTTLSALVLLGRQAYLAHVGDTRIYLLRDGVLTQLTGDHSEAAELLRLRLITPEQAHTHPRRSVLTRTMGGALQLRPDFQRVAVQAGDRFLLCTDGLWGEVEPEALVPALAGPPPEACDRLVALACERGGSDNVSLSIVHVLDPGPVPTVSPPSRMSRLLAGLRGG